MGTTFGSTVNRKHVSSLLTWIGSFAVAYWLVGESLWLNIFIASATSSILHLSAQIRENRFIFELADAELVRVSALATRLEEELADMKTLVEDHN